MHLKLSSPVALFTATLVVSLLSACTTTSGARHGGSRPTATPPTAAAGAQVAAANEEVANSERAFAQTLAKRDLKAFVSFLSPDAIFFSGSNVEHGPAEIAQVWAPFFSGSQAPFSWHPDHVEVTADGHLALSTGPILQEGKVVGRFNSVWRLEEGNTWRILFDKGEPVCGAADRHVTRSPEPN